MRLIFLQPSNKFTKNWLKCNNINLHIIERILSTVASKEKLSKKDWMYDLDISVEKDYSSGYYFGVNELHISSQACEYKQRKRKLQSFLTNVLHEFRHWIQDKLFGVPGEELDYTSKDVENSAAAYWNNKHEIDARAFEVTYMQKCYDLYIALEKF